MQIISRKDALLQGLNYYFTGKQCKNGHTSKRVVCNGTCYECVLLRNSKYIDSNRERFKLYQKEWYKDNKEKVLKYGSEYRTKNKEKIRDKNLKYRERFKERHKFTRIKNLYGISKEEFESLLLKSKGKCMICKLPERRKNSSGKVKQLSVDHCHKTGKVRGLLCQDCNQALGLFKDSKDSLTNAINYLKYD